MSAPSLHDAVQHVLGVLTGVQTLDLIVNDPDRATPTGAVLDALFAQRPSLNARVIVACGTHRHRDAQRHVHVQRHGLARAQHIVWHDAVADTVLDPHRAVLAIGSVEPHYFAGWTGAHKTLTVGLWSRARIEANHAYALEPAARVCTLDGNPLFDDIARQLKDDLTRRHAPTLTINLVASAHTIHGAFAGAPLKSLRAAASYALQTFTETLDAPLDRLIARVDAPLDQSLYQALKGVENNTAAVRDGGAIVLVAACPEGVGIDHFMASLRQASSWKGVREHVQDRGYRLGDHKAVRLRHLTDQREVKVALVSEGVTEADAKVCGMVGFHDEASALAWARRVAPGGREHVLDDAGNRVLFSLAST